MLFDLKGKRRRAVQGTYLMLAMLMGVGLIAFGIGSGVNGGLSDLFSGGNGSNKGNQVIQKKIDTANKQLAVNPKNTSALGEVIRGHYQLATAKSDPNTGQFTKDASDDLRQAATAWERYLSTNPKKPDLGLARVMVQAYSGLAQITTEPTTVKTYWTGAATATELIAAAKPIPNNYIALVQYASLAGQTSKADLAGKKAISLAPKGQRKAVQQQVAAAKAAGATQAGGGSAGASSGTAP
ncbi:MAG: hypothetical protein QOC77_760 [Thermoleophilaceae bacterium]|jgi:hypothetical protein|nr:hypothetical protein [Thermoleophilaceae bacterium]